jgi:hypothetical protein
MPTVICPHCHYFGEPGKKKRGSKKLAVLAWLIFPFGLPYTLWRMFSTVPVCKECGNEMLIDANTPVGERMMDTILGATPKTETSAPPKPTPVETKKTVPANEPSPPPPPPAQEPIQGSRQDPNEW